MKTNTNIIESFSSLRFYAMTVPSTGCIATGRLLTGHNITVTGGNNGQQADGYSTFLVELIRGGNIVFKRNVSRDGLALLIEHYRKMGSRRRRYIR